MQYKSINKPYLLLVLLIMNFSCTKNGVKYYLEENLNNESNNYIVNDNNFNITNSVYLEDNNLYVSTYFIEKNIKEDKILSFELKVLNISNKEVFSEIFINETGEYVKNNGKVIDLNKTKYTVYKTFDVNKNIEVLKIEIKIKSKHNNYIKKVDLFPKQQYLLWQK